MSMNYDCVTFSLDQQTEEAIPAPTSSMSVQGEASPSMATPSSCGDADEKFLVADWNSLVNQDMDFDGSGGLSVYDVREPQCQGSNGLDTMVEQFPEPPPFNNVSIPATSALFHPNFCINDIHGNLKGKKRKSMPECSVLHPHPLLYRVQKVEAEQQKNVAFKSVESSDGKDVKKQKSETTGGITHKPNAENIKECSQDGDATKEDYSHVRARRGQATDSHSLAERVRRENISKRMRLLQDLVPGCNKITGKKMMLDEIINYVQSLQRQVEVLSMKLAAVDPELQYDIDRILWKDVLQSSGNLSLFGFGPGLNTPHPLLQRSSSLAIAQPDMLLFNLPNSVEMTSSSIPQIASLSQLPGVWNDELQTALQNGFIPNAPVVGPDLNDFMKLEL